MSNRTVQVDDRLYAHILENSLRETELQRRLREETAAMPHAGMQISPEQGQFMALLIELVGAQRCLEVGTFTGYSALAVALALPAHGRIVDFKKMPRKYILGEAGTAPSYGASGHGGSSGHKGHGAAPKPGAGTMKHKQPTETGEAHDGGAGKSHGNHKHQ